MIERNGRKIIVSVDDFGISQKATQNILKLIDQKKIDRVEVMMSKNITPGDVQKLLASGAALDIHLHLVKDKLDWWQTNPREINSGIAKRMVFFIFNFFFGKGIPRKAQAEWERQINDFEKIFGKKPDGISSHEHIHFFSPYFRIVTRLARKHSISYIRWGKYSAEKIEKESKIAHILGCLKKGNKSVFENSRLDSSDFMVSLNWIGNFDQFLNSLPTEKTIDIVFHPEIESEYKIILEFVRT